MQARVCVPLIELSILSGAIISPFPNMPFVEKNFQRIGSRLPLKITLDYEFKVINRLGNKARILAIFLRQ
jgi:hypothetical protein